MDKLLEWIYKHYGLTIIIVVWGLALFTAVTLKVFYAPADIPMGTATTYGSFFVFASLIIGLWKWRRDK
jgi:hypothetical protein